MEWLVLGYWCLAALAIGAGVLLCLQTWEHCRFAHSRVWDFNFNFNPVVSAGRIALISPCKGADAELEGNLRPLFEQDHDNYELIFSVESSEDPACHTIRRLISQYPGQRARLVVAGLSTHSGQKVHNLLAATENLRKDIDILVFVDADVKPPRDWLRLLTQRLHHFVAATGYRWCVPKRPTLANYIVASIDSSIVPIMFPGLHHIVWGGSWAIRREAFDRFQMREAWQGTLSDDLVAANVLARHRSLVSMEPACILPTSLDMDLRGMAAFVRRQFMIGRYYSPVLWSAALVWNCVLHAFFWGSLAAAVWGASHGAIWAWQPAVAVTAVYALSVSRAWLRQGASRFYLPDLQGPLAKSRRFDIWFGPLAGLACCFGLISSSVGRRIVWKNISYEMQWGGQIRAIEFRTPRWSPRRDEAEAETARHWVA